MPNKNTLCSACKHFTFTHINDGFTHPLSYPNIVRSGQSCQLCRLIVCSMSKLQIMSTTSYATNRRYDALMASLPSLPAVIRRSAPDLLPFEQEYPLSSIAWTRDQYRGEPGYPTEVRKGNFNDGETIHVTAPEGKAVP
jgi:hypothetical protein